MKLGKQDIEIERKKKDERNERGDWERKEEIHKEKQTSIKKWS